MLTVFVASLSFFFAAVAAAVSVAIGIGGVSVDGDAECSDGVESLLLQFFCFGEFCFPFFLSLACFSFILLPLFCEQPFDRLFLCRHVSQFTAKPFNFRSESSDNFSTAIFVDDRLVDDVFRARGILECGECLFIVR